MGLAVGGDADAGVCDLEPEGFGVAPDAQVDGAGGWGVLEGVGEEVVQERSPQFLVQIGFWISDGNLSGEGLPWLCLKPHVFQNAVTKDGNIDDFRGELQASSFGAGEGEDVVEQLRHAAGRAVDALYGILLLVGGENSLVGVEGLGGEQDGAEGGAEFVGCHGEEADLQVAEFAGAVEGGLRSPHKPCNACR